MGATAGGAGAATGGERRADACPDEEALLAYLEAGPAGAGAPALGAHVDGCGRCRQVVAALGPLLAGEAGEGPLLAGEAGAAGSLASRPPASLEPSGERPSFAPDAGPAHPGSGAAIGAVLAGKYRVLGELGRGGMGVVLEAEHVGVAERFAVKLLRAEGGGEGGVRRLLREAKLAAQVGGRHVAKVYDVGTLDDGRTFLVMERLYGEDLQAALRRRGALPVGEALGYLVQACEAVGRAHAAGVVHRDLKPANLFLSKDESEAGGDEAGVVIKVLDFGLAKLAARPRLDDELSLTTSATVIGSPRYMSPEQIRDARGVDARSDVWSLGVILFEMLAGEPPFAGTSVSGLWASIVADPPRPLRALRPEVPPALAALVDACLVKDPAGRLESVAALARRARALAAEASAVASSPARAPAARGPARRRRRAAAEVAVAAFGLAAIGVAVGRGGLAGEEAPSALPAHAAPTLSAAPQADASATAEPRAAGADASVSAEPKPAGADASAAAELKPAGADASAAGEASARQGGAGAPAMAGSAGPKRLEQGRGTKEAGHRVHGAASVNVFFGKETDSRH